ncbi:MAG: YHS domain-containing (seleno)protein [Cytophagales bacterium]|nr:YHS domain-containing (seleno)protein [Cytophagales bacterium]
MYRFSTVANKELFKKEPAKYAPGFGGYCPVAASMGDVEDIENDQFEVYNNKLYLFMNKKAKEMWQKDKVTILAKATANWPCLTHEKGKLIK